MCNGLYRITSDYWKIRSGGSAIINAWWVMIQHGASLSCKFGEMEFIVCLIWQLTLNTDVDERFSGCCASLKHRKIREKLSAKMLWRDEVVRNIKNYVICLMESSTRLYCKYVTKILFLLLSLLAFHIFMLLTFLKSMKLFLFHLDILCILWKMMKLFRPFG